MKVVILAGGYGTRLAEETATKPKPMVKIGQKPILKSGISHTYSSNCLLTSPIGSMSGFYTMINFSTAKEFEVEIPVFDLAATFTLN